MNGKAGVSLRAALFNFRFNFLYFKIILRTYCCILQPFLEFFSLASFYNPKF